jgi:hypothetical protein
MNTNSYLDDYAKAIKKNGRKNEAINIAEEILSVSEQSDFDTRLFEFSNKLLSASAESDTKCDTPNDIRSLQKLIEERRGKELFGYSW